MREPDDGDLFAAIDGGTPASMELDFKEFDKNNPKVWAYFVEFAFQALKAGRTVLSAGLITERIRWETWITTTTEDFKINNNFRAFYARKFMKEYPEYGESFRTRKSVADAA